MNQYLIVLRVDGRRTEVVISATSDSNARKLATAQFGGCEVRIISSKKL